MIITLTGKPCSGKSTMAKYLVEKHGFTRIGVGDMFRAEAKRRNMSIEDFNVVCLNDPSFDRFVDNKTKEMGEKLAGQKYIFDSRLAWHFIPNSFKVYVNVSDEEMVKRLIADNRVGIEKTETPEEAKTTLLNRRALEDERYKKVYGVDMNDFSNYDYVLDTSVGTVEENAKRLWKEYQKFCKKNK